MKFGQTFLVLLSATLEKFLKNWLNIFRVNSFKVIVSTNKLLKQLFQYSQPNVEQN